MRIALLLGLLALAAVTDARSHRIPNGIPASLLLAALVLGAVEGGAGGELRPLGGAAVGLCALLPFYALGGMGAGDVKLMAGAGALLGSPAAAIFATGATLLLGAVLALGFLAARLVRARFATPAGAGVGLGTLLKESAGVFPYAVAVLGGTVSTLIAAPYWTPAVGVG